MSESADFCDRRERPERRTGDQPTLGWWIWSRRTVERRFSSCLAGCADWGATGVLSGFSWDQRFGHGVARRICLQRPRFRLPQAEAWELIESLPAVPVRGV